MIKEVVNSHHKKDEINEVLGTGIYASRYYWRTLRDQILGVHSGDLVGVSRYYLTLKPTVVVDFEPVPPEKFYVEEKRRFFLKKGIVYIPIFLGQRLSKEQFEALSKQEHEILVRGFREAIQDSTLLSTRELKDPMFKDPTVLQWIDSESLRRLKEKKLKGAAANKHLPHIVTEVVNELRGLPLDGVLERIRSNSAV